MQRIFINRTKNFFWGLPGLLFILAFAILLFAIFRGAFWIMESVLPLLVHFSWFLSILIVVVILPMALFESTRKRSVSALEKSSVFFGITLWIYCALTTYILWGFLGLFIGLVIFGVGVGPLAVLAALISLEWSILGVIIYLIIFTFGTRILANKIKEDKGSKKHGNFIDSDIITYCGNCNTRIEDNFDKCPNCGETIN